MRINQLYIVFLLIAASCVSDPQKPDWEPYPPSSGKGAVILCEGLWGLNNSSLTYYDFQEDTIINNIFSKNNSGELLGDLANDIEIHDGKLFIAVTSGRDITRIDAVTFKLEKRMFPGPDAAPREIIFLNGMAYFTDLYRHLLVAFDPQQMIVTGSVYSGPYPEGINAYEGKVFVANSGLGDYHHDKQGAGTISVIDAFSLKKIDSLIVGPNVKEVLVNEKHGLLYAAFDHLPSKTDSIGGIVEYDLFSLSELRRWKVRATKLIFSLSADTLMFLNDNDVAAIDLNVQSAEFNKLIINPNRQDNWYSIAISPDNEIWVCNAKNYNVEGEVLVYNLDNINELKKRFKVGVNPKKIIFR